MYKLRVIPHAAVTGSELEMVARLKMAAWPHSLESQLNWMNAHLGSRDLHLLLMNGNVPAAYMNLVDAYLTIHASELPVWGVGNVCSAVRGRGHGAKLMEEAARFIRSSERKAGLLFCKEGLVSFYERFGWIVVPNEMISFQGQTLPSFKTMVLELSPAPGMFYSGKIF